MSVGVLDLYAAERKLPPLVQHAVAGSRRAAVDQACRPEVGRLLEVLATSVTEGTIAELGTACGIGTAWLTSGLRAGVELVTVERDAARAAVARGVFATNPHVRVIHDDWVAATEHAPFALLFADGGPQREAGAPAQLAALLRPGGLLLLDDLTPGRAAEDDEVRGLWLGSPLYRTVELTLSPEAAVLLAVRL